MAMKLILLLCVLTFSLAPVAFFTLLERQILGNFHIRLGPKIVGPQGFFQPISDAMKLFVKSDLKIRFNMKEFWSISPIIAMMIYLISIAFLPLGGMIFFSKNLIVLFICILSLNIYFLVYGSFFSGSKYSTLGGYRSVTQMISYEIIFIFLLVTMFLIFNEWKLDFKWSFNLNILFIFPFFISWSIIMMVESNRLPFDFLEGESELVSGFNTEYWGGFFSLFFIYEYGMMLLMSIMSSQFLFSGLPSISFFFFFVYLFLWFRVTYPRFRFDFMMELGWKKILFMVMSILMMFI